MEDQSFFIEKMKLETHKKKLAYINSFLIAHFFLKKKFLKNNIF